MNSIFLDDEKEKVILVGGVAHGDISTVRKIANKLMVNYVDTEPLDRGSWFAYYGRPPIFNKQEYRRLEGAPIFTAE